MRDLRAAWLLLCLTGCGLAACGGAEGPDPPAEGQTGGDGGNPSFGASGPGGADGGGGLGGDGAAANGGASAGGGGGSGGGASTDWTLRVSQAEFITALALPSRILVDTHATARVAIAYSGFAEGIGVWDEGTFLEVWDDATSTVSPKAWEFDHDGDLYAMPDSFGASVVHFIASGDTWTVFDLQTPPALVPWWPPQHLVVATGPTTRVALFGDDAYYDATGKLGFSWQPLYSYDVTWSPAPAFGHSIHHATYLADGSGEVYGANADGDFGRCVSVGGGLSCAATFELAEDTYVVDVTVSLADADAVYVTTYDGAGTSALLSSFDRGATFTPVALPLGGSTSFGEVIVSPADAERLVVRQGPSTFSSHDGGGSWDEITPPPGALGSLGIDAAGTLFALADFNLFSTADY